jgi:signal transduction histidine kinase
MRQSPISRWLLCGALALTLGAGWPAAAAVLHLETARVVESAAPAFVEGVGAAAPAERALPDVWTDGAPARSTWYRFDLPAPASDAPLAIYIERACSQLEVQLNGRPLWRAGPQPLCHRPQLIPLPATLLQPGINRLDLRVTGEPLTHVAARGQAGGLSAVEVGPQSDLAARHARATLLQVEAPQALCASLLLMGGFLFVLGFRHREQSHLAYFGALCIGWALVEARRWLPGLPLSDTAAELLQSAMLAFVTLAAVQFLLREARWRSRTISRLLALQLLAMPLSLLLTGPAWLNALMSVWLVIFVLEIAAAAAFHLMLRRRLQGQLPVLAATALGTVGAALAVQVAGRYAALPAGLLHGAALVAPLGLVLVGLRLVRQHGRALQAADSVRVNLEGRIRDATAEIERNFRQLTELRVEQVTERERKRIAADLHDDLGAKLLTIVHTSEDARISTLAREALEEMRLSVRGLTGKPVRLADALGDWRAELMSRLTQSGIEGEWESPDDLPQTLSARTYVQTTRILRESTSNIIKHSGASRCSFTCGIADGDLQLTIQDNGNGIPLELDGRLDRGHGMASMKHRAKQMQGQCLVESGPGYGTVIRLTLPLDRAIEPPP